jgi:TRAP-type C4-dicarboxylate transport system substrate-binding protein
MSTGGQIIMKKTLYVAGLAVAASLLLTLGHTDSRAQDDSYRWNVPLIWTPPHHVRTEQEAFRERVLERTDGEVDISLFQFGELGLVDSDVLSVVRGGEFPLVELDHSKTAGDEPLFQIFNLPGLAFSIEDAMTIAEATKDVREQALADWNAVEVGMVHYNPPQGIFTKEPVNTVEDLQDVSIRVYSGVLLSSFELLGARPQLIPWGDAPAALLQGVVDGAITSPSSGISVGFGDTTKYMTVMPLSNRISWIMNKDVWESLDPEVQQILREEADATGKRIQANWDQEEAGVGELVEGAGMTFVAPSEEFQAQVTELLRPVWDEWAASTDYGPQALEQALEALGRN